ncbi:exonuclease domain-containing protein [Micromonospora psammae]|uniref:exonuclease domain-containing protein n=1 Tax=Micromonospora sp. CPCC 205556 TaxID=3122398 RepID=UPI002FF15D45
MFVPGHLTRQQGVDPRALTFAVLKLETTGLHPNRGSRICELAIVRMRGDGVVLDEYATLVDPGLRITNDEFHGITNADVKGAPTFPQIAGDVVGCLSGAVVVSHQLEFVDKFLSAEFGRLGVALPPIPGLCSLVTARTQLDRWGYKLDNVANLVTGEWPAALPSALGGARALAGTIARLVGESPQPLHWQGPRPEPLPSLPGGGATIAPRIVGLRKGSDGWLATLTARLPYLANPPRPRPDGVRDYRALLAHALADGRIVGEEAAQLATLATRAGLTQTTARQVHEEFLADARARAEADGVVTTVELKELQRAAKELAASHLISDLEEAAAANRARNNGPLRGWRIMQVGDSAAMTEVVDYAVEHGAKVAVNLTKTVRLLISDGAAQDDPRIAKALAAGVDVVTVEQARKLLEGEATKVGGGLFVDSAGEQVANRLAAERAAANRPEWHEFWRPRELTPVEYRARFVDRRDDWDEAALEIRITVPAARQMQPGPVPGARKAPVAAKKSGCAATFLFGGAILVGVAELVRQVVA